MPKMNQSKKKTSAYETPEQDKLKADIARIESKISSLTSLKESGFVIAENISHLKETRDQSKQNQLKLKTLIADVQGQQKQRVEKKKITSELYNQSTFNVSKLAKFTHPTRDRSPLEDSYLQLHGVIVDLATAGAGADFCRRTNALNACQTIYTRPF